MYAQTEKPKENAVKAKPNSVAQKKSDRFGAVTQRKLLNAAGQSPQETQLKAFRKIDLKSISRNQGLVLQAMRDGWPDSVNVGGIDYTGRDGDTGIYYELPNVQRVGDRHVSIHKAVGKTKSEWYQAPSFSVKVHQTRNKYVVVDFLGAQLIASHVENAQGEGKDESVKEAVSIGVNFWRGLTGSSLKTF
jgi:hypothetical protein